MTPDARNALLTVAEAVMPFDRHGPKSIMIHDAGVNVRLGGEGYDLTTEDGQTIAARYYDRGAWQTMTAPSPRAMIAKIRSRHDREIAEDYP